MIVMKFGGTSIGEATSVERVAEIIRGRLALEPVVVVSAMGKTTRKLLQAAEASAAGDSPTTLAIVADLKATHAREALQLIKNIPGREVFQLIEKYFDELRKLLEGLAILGEVPPRGLDKILSYGELLSSAIVADALAERGISARLLDSREFIKTDDCYGAASPVPEITNPRIREVISPVIANGFVPIVQGFIGSTRDGATTTLGFEGSDYSAAIVGAALGAEDIEIWKDVSGLMTADPAVFPGARTVKVCTFAEAAELTYFGAKVLHPKAIYPAAQKNIPVHIYNSKKPDATGTTITSNPVPSANLVKSIAYKRPVAIISAIGDSSAGVRSAVAQNIFLTTLLNKLESRQLIPLITAVSASSIALAIDARALTAGRAQDLVSEISKLGTVSVAMRKAIVTLVGEDLRSDSRVMTRVFNAISEFELGIVLRGSSPIGMNFVVDEHNVEIVVAKLHEVFFQQIDPQVFE